MTTEQQRPAMERHIQTAIAAILVGLVGWIGVSITGMAESVARLEVKQTVMQRDIDKLTALIDDGVLPQTRLALDTLNQRITRHEGLFDSIWPRLREMKERIQAMEPKDANRWQH